MGDKIFFGFFFVLFVLLFIEFLCYCCNIDGSWSGIDCGSGGIVLLLLVVY